MMSKMQFIEHLLLLNSLAIIGFHYATQEGMILGSIRQIPLPEWIMMPLYDCPTCMASIHSTYIFIPAVLIYDVPLWIYPIYILTLAGLNTIINSLINYLRNE